MSERPPKNLSRYFVYVSDRKLAELLDRIDEPARRNIAAELDIDLRLLAVKLTSSKADRSLRARGEVAQIAAVEAQIRKHHDVGGLDTRHGWLETRLDMRWTPLEDGKTVLFCGSAGQLLVLLCGSVSHVKGWAASAEQLGSYALTVGAAIGDGGLPEEFGRNLEKAARRIRGITQPTRFLARVLCRGVLGEGSAYTEFLLATPLYVEGLDEAGPADDAAPHAGEKGSGAADGPGFAVAQCTEAAAPPGLETAHPAQAGNQVPDATADAADPVTVGRYEILRRLGEGSMGVVYLARDLDGSHVAVKMLRSALARDPFLMHRFSLEADNARKITAAGVAQVIQADTDHGRPYLVTEFIDGPTLDEKIVLYGPLPPTAAKELCAATAAALAAVHSAGIVHHDLTPSNIILSPSGPKIIDFGISRSLGSDEEYTAAGFRLGTRAYMSPEQVEDAELTPASDVFSWAGAMVYAVTGHQPFGSENAPWVTVLSRILNGPPDLTDVPAELRDIIGLALSTDPAARPTALQLLERLTARSGSSEPEVAAGTGARESVPGTRESARQRQAESPLPPERPVVGSKHDPGRPSTPSGRRAREHPDLGANHRHIPRRRWHHTALLTAVLLCISIYGIPVAILLPFIIRHRAIRMNAILAVEITAFSALWLVPTLLGTNGYAPSVFLTVLGSLGLAAGAFMIFFCLVQITRHRQPVIPVLTRAAHRFAYGKTEAPWPTRSRKATR
ncbi:MAG TPA: serine/threonine-protein kinase [Streptosporangiaceae bacterium]|nr:serine/threonine-protein kinase [Streptosporangiaceae bacterium]